MKALRVFLILSFMLSLGIHSGPAAAQTAGSEDVVINSATLSLYATQTFSQPVSAHRATKMWTEAGVTWNSFDNEYDADVVDSFVPVIGWNTLDIRSLVQGWVDGSIPNQGVLLAHDTAVADLDALTNFLSSEYANTILRPRLEICYTAPGSSETCIIVRRTGSEVEDVFDTTIRSNAADINFGTSTSLYTRHTSRQIKHVLLGFTIPIEVLTPGIDLVKYTNGVIANDPDGSDVPQLEPGEVVVWTYRITNTGETSIPRAQISVTDNQPGVTPAFSAVVTGDADTIFEPGEVWDYTAEGVAVDLVNPPDGMIVVENACTVQGSLPGRTAYINQGTVTIPGDTDSAESTYCNPPEDVPGVELVKYTNGVIANDPDGSDVPHLEPGDVVVWTYRITNTGKTSIPSAQIIVTDNQPGVTPTFSEVVTGDADTIFEPGEVWDYTAEGVAVDLVNPPDGMIVVEDACTFVGQLPGRTAYINQGTVTIPGDTDSAESTYCNPPDGVPGVDLVKYTNGIVANDPNGSDVPQLQPGDAVVWTYRITNTGETTIPRPLIYVTDNQPGVTPAFVEEFFGDGDTLFEPEEVWDYTAEGTAVNLLNPPDGMIVVEDVCTVEGSQPGRTAYINQGTVTVPGSTDSAESTYCNPPETIEEPYKVYLPIIITGTDPSLDPENFHLDIGFEDLPLNSRGNDYDYNDWVIEVRFSVRRLAVNPDLIDQITFEFDPTARGSIYSHTFSIALPANTFATTGTSTLRLFDVNDQEIRQTNADFVGSGNTTYRIFDNSRDIFPVNKANTLEGVPTVAPLQTASLTINFTTPVFMPSSAISISDPHGGGLFFEPQVLVLNTGDIITRNDLRMLTVAVYETAGENTYIWPEERIRIDNVYDQVTFHSGVPPVIDFPANWWFVRNNCAYDGALCVLP